MQLEHIKAVVRPRNAWEAIDLGFTLVQAWWLDLIKVWLACLLPLALLIYALFWEISWLAAFLLWFSKPLLDICLLHFFSHALFGQKPSVWETYRALLQLLVKKNLLWGAVRLRFSFSRPFILPVWQLENVRGKARAQRLKVLLRNQTETGQWLSFSCYLFEWAIYLSLFVLLKFFLPENFVHSEEFGFALLHQDTVAVWAIWTIAAFNIISITIVEPFFVASGFALYLNRRTHLEGWDIELTFRQMAGRLQQERA